MNSNNELLYLRWKNHYSSLYGSFLSFFSNPVQANYDDATVACDGAFYPVHRLVLSVSSPYFAQMFSAVNKAGQHPVIVLKDISRDIFEILLKFIYLGEVNVQRHKFPSLISAAKSLNINGLSGYHDSGDNTFSHTPNDHSLQTTTPETTAISEDIPNAKREATSKSFQPEVKKQRLEPCVSIKKLNSPLPSFSGKHLANSFTTSGGVTIAPKRTSETTNEETQQTDSGTSEQSTLPVILEYHSLNHNDEPKNSETVQNNSNEKDIFIKTELPDEDAYSNHTEFDEPNGDELSLSVFDCKLCSFKCSTEEKFDLHMLEHPSTSTADSSNFLGEISVTKSFPSEFNQKLEKKEEQDFQFDFSSISARTKLEGTITSYNCSLCSYSAPNKHELSEHGFIHKGGKGFQCSDCSYSTIHKHSLVSHRRIHTGEKPFRCLYCDYSSRQKGSILYHQRRRHSKCKLFKCNSCPYKSGRKSDYEEHVVTYHPIGEAPYSCSSCEDVKLQTKKEYVKHMEQHLPNDKIQRCPVCFYSTRNKNVFNLHILRHKNRRRMKKKGDGFGLSTVEDDSIEDLPDPVDGQFYCKYCAFKTPHKGVLTVHIRRHTGEKPYACHLCDYRSAQAGNLDSHLKNHEIRKTYLCPHCSYSAGYEANLDRHVRRDHLSLPGDENYENANSNDLSYRIENEPGNHDGEESSNPMEAMCQVQLEEPNEEMYFPNDLSMLAFNASSSQMGDGFPIFLPSGDKASKPPIELPSYPPKVFDPNAPDPYVTEVNGILRCNECFYSTRMKVDMETHQYHHSNEKKCICQYCDYRCIRNQHLTRHVQKYKGGPTVKCLYCSYKTCVLNARHRKMCKFFHELYTTNPDVRIDNSLALTGISGITSESGGAHLDLASLLHPTTGTSYARTVPQSGSSLILIGSPMTNKEGSPLSTTEVGDKSESGSSNVQDCAEERMDSPIFDPEFELEVTNACDIAEKIEN